MTAYRLTDTYLDRILARKIEELSAYPTIDDLFVRIDGLPEVHDFATALRQGDRVALIAEIKQASPSKGVLIADFDPVRIAHIYADNGASALSILTDQRFFQGHLDHLMAVRAVVDLPILRKDFIIDPRQIVEARLARADAVLLIVMALEPSYLRALLMQTDALGMTALVEVHTPDEARIALDAGARVIGVNNRDLRTFQEDLTTTERIATVLPSGVTLIAESAIRTADDVRRMGTLGAHAVLVGEGLLRADDIAAQVRTFSQQRRPSASAKDAVMPTESNA